MHCSKQRPPVAEKEGTCLSKKDLELRYDPVLGEMATGSPVIEVRYTISVPVEIDMVTYQ
ncbi:hypothetical protein FBF83_12140 [Pseudalkalibacillus hwajinpoensis]|uniref:Uncharacterized protein n=1 Tax=Guptibacillus hwajinpoensis TaxID=208199 RepID=A0A4V5Q1J7_9BACL|nr:hypothetical protein FBF83_12140 [Pseudalkalibacillus hwajinpoensis]